MIIKSSQYKQLSDGTKAASVRVLAKALGSKFPEELHGMTEEEWIAGVARRVDRALKYRILDDEDVFGFLMMDLRFGEHFENKPEYKQATEILHHRTLMGKRKVERLHDLLYSYKND